MHGSIWRRRFAARTGTATSYAWLELASTADYGGGACQPHPERHLLAPRPRSKEKTWTLTLVHRGDWGDKTIWRKCFRTERMPLCGRSWLIDVLLNNAEYGEGLRKAGT